MPEEDLWLAAAQGELETVRRLLDSGVPVEEPSDDGKTPLMFAAMYAKEEVLELLLARGADPNFRCRGDKAERRRSLADWEARALVEEVNDDLGCTPLLETVDTGMILDEDRLRILRRLVEAGADPNIGNVQGVTPLSRAAWREKADAVALLIELGADVNLRDVHGYSALMHARRAVNFDRENGMAIVQALRNAGADEAGWLDVELEWAATLADLAGVQAALDQGADVNFLSDRGSTPLHEAVSAKKSHPEPALQIIKLLLERGADPNRRRGKDSSPLCSAIEDRDLEMVRLLLQYGADPSAPSFDWAPIDLAKAHKRLDIVEVLKEAGARGKSLKKERGFNDQEAEVAAVLVRQGIEEVSAVLAERGEILRGIQGREVTCGSGSLLVYQLVGHPWTVVETAADDFIEPELAADLSRSLGTAAIWIGASDTAGAFGYDLFEAGERTEWFYDGPGRKENEGWERDFGSREKKRKPSKNANPQEILHRFLRAQDAFYMGPQLGLADQGQTFFSGWGEQELVRADVVQV